MAKHATTTTLKQFRELRELTAAELAKAAGVSRQTIYAIEDGSYVPNTSVALRLARVLGAHVEELFRLHDEPPLEKTLNRAVLLQNWNQRDGRMVRVGRVGDRLIAAPQAARSAYLPVSNGWINDRFISREAGQKISVETYAANTDGQLVIAGCDPALSMLERLLTPSGVDVISIPCSSRQALRWLRQGVVHVAGSHLFDRRSGEHNLSALRQVFPSETMHVVGFAQWEQGLLVARGNPKAVKTL